MRRVCKLLWQWPSWWLVLALGGLSACSTATNVTIDSSPPGARIFVQGVDTGLTTPAGLDLEEFAPRPDDPMPVELRLEGYVPTWTFPYPARHRCDQLVCEKKRRTCVGQHLPLLIEGGGVRIDTDLEDMEVALDSGVWVPLDGPPGVGSARFGATIKAPPGPHVFWWRARPGGEAARSGQNTVPWPIRIAVPESGYLSLNLHRWPWGIPSRDPLASR